MAFNPESLKGAKFDNNSDTRNSFGVKSSKKEDKVEENEVEDVKTDESEVKSEEVETKSQTIDETVETKEVDSKTDVDETKKEIAEESKEKRLEFSDDDVLKYLKESKGLELESLDSLSKRQESDLPEDVKKYLEYKKETNRGYQDFANLQRDWTKENEDVAIETYLREKNPYFDTEDIADELAEFKFDEDLDDEAKIKKIKRKKKKLLNEAVSFLESQKEKYKAPLEGSSSESVIPEEYKEAKTKLSEMTKSQQERQKMIEERQRRFLDETKSIFSNEFEGFEFDINGEKKVFKSSDADKILSKQSDINNFISQFTDENGAIKDVRGYHKALNVAMNVDKVAKHFYELGQAEAVKNEAKESKNINFQGRKVSEPQKANRPKIVNTGTSKFGFKY